MLCYVHQIRSEKWCSKNIFLFQVNRCVFFFQEKASCWMSAHGLFLVMFVCAHLAPDRRGQNKKRSKFQPTRKYGIEHGISWLYHLFESLSDYGYITFLESLSEFEWFDFLFSIRSPLVPRTNIFSRLESATHGRNPGLGPGSANLMQTLKIKR